MHQLVVNKPVDSAEILYPKASEPFPLPVFGVPAGYPSAAQDYLQQELDLTGYLLGPRRASIFLFRIGGVSMKYAGILDGDVIIVDRSLDAQNGDIVVAEVNGEYTCKYYRRHNGETWLVPANDEFKPIRIAEGMEFSIFGCYAGLARKGKARNTAPFKIPVAE